MKIPYKFLNTMRNIGLVTGGAGLVLRNRRQEEMFSKIMKRFPHARDMVEFLNVHDRPELAKSLDENCNDYAYAQWVKYNIIKEGHFWNIFAQFFFFGLPTGIYNTIDYAVETNKNAEDSVLSNTY